VLKTFTTGIVLGVAGILAALYYVPAVDLGREVSIIAVAPNGGNTESFHVNVPEDRIMVGTDSGATLPPGMVWPADDALRGVNTELFKIRNSRDAVIGVGSRVAVRNRELGDVIEWVLHLPARGTIYVSLQPESISGARAGGFRAGTREFSGLVGNLSERWLSTQNDGGAVREIQSGGKVELVATYIAKARPEPEEAAE